ncbi:MAG: hypothetical protein NVS4B9_38880 [Ktedonobacteraceae bacterium]
MSTSMVGRNRNKGEKTWTVRSFVHEHKSATDAARIAHAACDEYRSTYNSKHTDRLQRTALIGVTVTASLHFSPFENTWICMVSATFEAMTYEKTRSISSEEPVIPVVHAEERDDDDDRPVTGERVYALIG